MAYWPVFVVAIVVGLIVFELISWIRRKVSPPVVEPPADVEAVDEREAELTRANMKIAVLESRLGEMEIVQMEESEALQEQYRKQVSQTEATYQRQMMVLAERLAANGKGNWKEAPELAKPEPVIEYPVRMAAEVDAWRKGSAVTVDEEAAAEPAVSTEASSSAVEPLFKPSVYEVIGIIPGLGVIGRGSNGSGEESAAPQPDIEQPGEDWVRVLAAAQEAAFSPGDPAAPDEDASDADAVEVSFYAEEESQQVLEQITLLDDADDDPVVELDSASDLEVAESTAVEAELAIEDEVTAEGEVVVEDEIVFEANSDMVDQEVGPELTENRWPALEDLAVQRAMARQLGSEMDADYLDDEELLREIGAAQEYEEPPAYSGATEEEMMGVNDWQVDPLEELSNHLNGEDEQPQAEQIVPEEGENEAESQPFADFADQDWEEMVYASAEALRHNESDIAVEETDRAGDLDFMQRDEEQMAVEPAQLDEEQAEIEATVAAIMSRAPEQENGDGDQEAAVQQNADLGGNGNGRYDAHVELPDAAQAAALTDELELPEVELVEDEPVAELSRFSWQRQPIIWEAEYYDNLKLADEPVVVRQDEDIDFDWQDNPPVHGLDPRTFSVRWSGALPLDEGQYRFVAQAPDGLRLWLNGRLVISAWYDQSEQTYQREFIWPGGNIDVRLEHYENGGDARAFLTWDRVA